MHIQRLISSTSYKLKLIHNCKIPYARVYIYIYISQLIYHISSKVEPDEKCLNIKQLEQQVYMFALDRGMIQQDKALNSYKTSGSYQLYMSAIIHACDVLGI